LLGHEPAGQLGQQGWALGTELQDGQLVKFVHLGKVTFNVGIVQA